MSRLTVTEKEHWKSRIDQRINKAIETLEAQDATLMPSIRAKADLAAHRKLGTADYHTGIEAIKKRITDLEAEQGQLKISMYGQALGKEATQNPNDYRLANDFWSLHRKHQERIEDELLAQSELGRRILTLRAEKDALLDTVWLATSNAQIRDLWSHISVVLGDDSTPLQQQILDKGTDAAEA